MNPQRLDTLVGKILRIVPDLGEHTATSTVSENGRYRIPNDNPFSTVEGARKEIWAYGIRNPHRLIWDVDPARPAAPALLAFNIGLRHVGDRRHHPQGRELRLFAARRHADDVVADGMGAIRQTTRSRSRSRTRSHAARSSRPIRSSSIRTWRRTAAMPSPAGSSTAAEDPCAQRQARVRRHHDRPDVGRRAAPTCSPPTMATRRPWRRFRRWTPAFAASSKRPTARAAARVRRCPASAGVSGRGRVDLRFAVDNEGELYILTKSDGMIRKVVGARATSRRPRHAGSSRSRAGVGRQHSGSHAAANPVASTPESIAAGKRAYDINCAACHGNMAQGAVKAGIDISIIEEQGGKQPPDLTDDQWDHGSTDGEIYAVIKKGVPPTMMAGWDGRIPDTEIWNIVNYFRTLGQKTSSSTSPRCPHDHGGPARPRRSADMSACPGGGMPSRHRG